MRRSYLETEAMKNEHIRRMGEPEPYRSLRLQRERIEAEQEHERSRAIYEAAAIMERRRIRSLGHKPCA